MGIILKDIKDPMMWFANKLMDCNYLRKCRKEEASAGVIPVVAHCAKGVIFSWAPYLVNQFLIDYMDAHDHGTEFHFFWLIILIYLVGW